MMTFKQYIASLPSDYIQMLYDEDISFFQAYQDYVKAWKYLEAKYGKIGG